LGAIVTWLFMRGRQARSAEDIAALETQLKSQDSLQQEREIAFEAANAQLTRAFTELANQSLKSNSENFLRLAEQNLGAQQDKAKHDFGEREKAVENMVKPIQKALEAAQKQISELEKSRSEAYRYRNSRNRAAKPTAAYEPSSRLCRKARNRFGKRRITWSMPCADRKSGGAGVKLRSAAWSNWRAWWNTVTFRNRFIPLAKVRLFDPT
jgi:hypothetical protein